MKKLLMVVLFASIATPAFAFAEGRDNGEHGENRGNKGHKSFVENHRGLGSEKSGFASLSQGFQYATSTTQYASTTPFLGNHFEKKSTNPHAMSSFKGKEMKEGNDGDKDEMRHFATSTNSVQVKTNYFLCKTSAGWDVVPVVADGSNNANKPSGFCFKLPHGLAKMLGTVPGTTATSTPPVADTTAPVISGVTSSGVTSSTAIISWTTNEAANGNIYFSTSTPVNTATAFTAAEPTFSTTHSFSLTALTPGTTYHFVVKSADAANNSATGTEQSFVTPAVADVTAPVISSVATSGIASTTATVAWNTNELATGKVYYGTGTSTPTTFVYNSTPSLAHSFSISGLTASSTYNFYVESADAASNAATSTLSSFITTL